MKKEFIQVIIVSVIITAIFFYPIFNRQIPFPGDLLVGGYAPYNSNSYFGIAPGGVPNKGQLFDVIRMLFPWKEYAVKSLSKGELPLWNPYNFSGTPFLANFQGGTFYPFNFLFLVLPILAAWTIYIIIQPFLAMLFTYLLLREFKLSRNSSLFGGIVFAFSSFMTVWLEYGNLVHSFLWLPLVLLLIEKYLSKPKTSLIFLLIISLTLSILAGYVQLAIYVFCFSFIFLLFRIFSNGQQKPWRKILFFIPVFIAPALLSAMQLLLTLEVFFRSARSAYSPEAVTRLLIPPVHIITTFIPDFFGNPATRNYWINGTYIERVSYVGVIPLFFILYALFTRKKPVLFWFFAGIGTFTYFMLFHHPVSQFFYSLPIPFISTTVPTRMMGIFCFAAAVCSAFGFNSWEKEAKSKSRLSSLILGSIYVLCWVLVFIFPHSIPQLFENLTIAKRNLMLPTVILIIFAVILSLTKFTTKKFTTLLIFLITLGDLFYFFHKITPFSPPEFFYPQTEVIAQLKKIQGINRSWGYGSAYMDTNFQTHEGVYSTEGYDPLFLKTYAQLISTSGNGKPANPLPRADVSLTKGYGPEDLKKNTYRQKLLNLLGVKYILNKNDLIKDTIEPDTVTFDPRKYKLVWQKTPWQIYENLQAAPRIFLTANYQVIKDNKTALNTLLKPGFNETNTLILSEDPDITRFTKLNSSIKLITYKPNTVEVLAHSDKDSLLFITDNFDSGWKAKVDDSISKIYIADYTFRAVAVPKGNHKVKFYYEPESINNGLILSGIVLTSLVVVYLMARDRKI